MHYQHLLAKLHEVPFKPFRIKLVNSTTYDIHEPWMISPGETSAVVVAQTRNDERGRRYASEWRTVSIAHMLEFHDIDSQEQKRKPA